MFTYSEKNKILKQFKKLNSKDEKKYFLCSLYLNYSYLELSKIFSVDIKDVLNFFIEINIKYCTKCKKLHPRTFFGKHGKGTFDKLKSFCKFHSNRGLKNSDLWLLILNEKLDIFKDIFEQKKLMIELRKEGMKYKHFVSLFGKELNEIILKFKEFDVKYCSYCNDIHSFNNFVKDKTTLDGFKDFCKRYYLDNKKEILHKLHNYNELNKEEINNNHRKYNKTFAKFDSFKNNLIDLIRRDPNNNNLLQVRCKQCKEWFNPTNSQCQNRIKATNKKDSMTENHFYCSDECKENCDIYRSRGSNKKLQIVNRDSKVQKELRMLRFKLVIEQYGFKCCEICGKTNSSFICHHFEGIRYNPLMSADIDSCIIICSECHEKIHSQKGCKTSDLRCLK